MSSINLVINGNSVAAEEGTTILEAAASINISIPTLCHIKGKNECSGCRICLVNADGRCVPACETEAKEGMNIVTEGADISAFREMTLRLMCENHRVLCDECPRQWNCELLKLSRDFGIDIAEYKKPEDKAAVTEGKCVHYDSTKCIQCRRCAGLCAFQEVHALNPQGRGPIYSVGFGVTPGEAGCIGCGQCAAVCPTAAAYPRDESEAVFEAIRSGKEVIGMAAPAVWKSLGEYFGEEIGRGWGDKVPAFLKKIGFRAVYRSTSMEKKYKELLSKEIAEVGAPVVGISCPAMRSYMKQTGAETSLYVSKVPESFDMTAERLRKENEGCIIVYVSTCTGIKAYEDEGKVDHCLTLPEVINMFSKVCGSREAALEGWKSLESDCFDTLSCEAEEPLSFTAAKICGVKKCTDLLSGKAEPQADFNELRACPHGCLGGGGQVSLAAKELSDYQSIIKRRGKAK